MKPKEKGENCTGVGFLYCQKLRIQKIPECGKQKQHLIWCAGREIKKKKEIVNKFKLCVL